jgi:acetyl-CoA C-acetyltransferase
MGDVVIVEAVRTPIGKRNGGLATMHSADLLAIAQNEVIRRAGIDPNLVGQVVGGCITQVGMQGFNVTRTAWLTGGLPVGTAATTVDSQCGSSQQALSMATAFIKTGMIDVAVACGVEIMSQVPMGSALAVKDFGKGVPKSYFSQHEYTSQFEAAERIAEKWDISRQDLDEFGFQSQERLAAAWEAGRFASQIIEVDAPDLGDDGKPSGTTHHVSRDEGQRATTMEALAGLKTVGRKENGFHTAGTSSQISDAASAVLLMSAEKAAELGLRPRAVVVDSCLVGVDPTLMLHGPIAATQHLLDRNGMTMSDIDLTEINEAFASVVLSWERELKADPATTNPNGGAIAHGHALGATGTVLITKAVHELERADKETALVTMCCGGGMATGTLLRRV